MVSRGGGHLSLQVTYNLLTAGNEMAPRFVAVPAVPAQTGLRRETARFYATTVPSCFNIYDNEEKCRLPESYPTRFEAEAECKTKNSPLILPMPGEIS